MGMSIDIQKCKSNMVKEYNYRPGQAQRVPGG
jgi:hypothetical protein